MTTTVAIVMSGTIQELAVEKGVQRHAHNHRNGHQRQKERPGIEEEKEGVATVDQKRDTQRQ